MVINLLAGKIDTVVMNPPFGTRKKGMDMEFLSMALQVLRIVSHCIYFRSWPFPSLSPSPGFEDLLSLYLLIYIPGHFLLSLALGFDDLSILYSLISIPGHLSFSPPFFHILL